MRFEVSNDEECCLLECDTMSCHVIPCQEPAAFCSILHGQMPFCIKFTVQKPDICSWKIQHNSINEAKLSWNLNLLKYYGYVVQISSNLGRYFSCACVFEGTANVFSEVDVCIVCSAYLSPLILCSCSVLCRGI